MYEVIDINFLKELYLIMDEFKINRIFTVTIKNNRIFEAHQVYDSNMGKNRFTTAFFDFLDDNFPFIYFNIFYKLYLRKYKRNLKKLLKRYDICKINSTAFNLYQGIYIKNNTLYINDIEIIKEDKTHYIDKINLKI